MTKLFLKKLDTLKNIEYFLKEKRYRNIIEKNRVIINIIMINK